MIHYCCVPVRWNSYTPRAPSRIHVTCTIFCCVVGQLNATSATPFFLFFSISHSLESLLHASNQSNCRETAHLVGANSIISLLNSACQQWTDFTSDLGSQMLKVIERPQRLNKIAAADVWLFNFGKYPLILVSFEYKLTIFQIIL